MFDEIFIKEMGLENMPREKSESLIKMATDELKRRVGARLVQNLSEVEAEEYMALENEETVVMEKMLEKYGDFENSKVFLNILQLKERKLEGKRAKRAAVKEYLKVKLLEEYAPNFREIVEILAKDIKNELLSNKDRILYSML